MKWDDYLKILQNISLRYFYIAGIAFVLGYVLLRKWVSNKKIQQKFPVAQVWPQKKFFSVVRKPFLQAGRSFPNLFFR